MVTISNLIFLLILAVVQSKSDRKLLRIVNGSNVKPGEIPYQVSLQFSEDSFHFCGGSVLNEHFVITAGHCAFDKFDEGIQAVIGTTNLNAPKIIHNVTRIYVHERFKIPSHYANDIALMKVHPPIQFDDFVSPIILPKPHQLVSKNEKALASGWGSIKGLELSLPKTLKKVEVTIVDQDYCSNLYKSMYRTIYPEQLCTHEVAYLRKGVCTGDSGGPLTVNKNILIGIISWSSKDPDCASPLYPDVHTRVSEYIDWINKYVK